jgi:hypothetical protein
MKIWGFYFFKWAQAFPLTLCRSGRRRDVVMMIIRAAGRFGNSVVTIPTNDWIAYIDQSNKKNKNKMKTENHVQVLTI